MRQAATASPLSSRPAAAAPASPIATQEGGETLLSRLTDLMEALLAVVEKETELVRAGRLAESGAHGRAKAELCSLYLAEMARLKANGTFLLKHLPKGIVRLQRQHELFHALLQINLAVLATAHAVAEGIIRGVAGELARTSAPQTYGPSGRSTAPNTRVAQPMAVARSF